MTDPRSTAPKNVSPTLEAVVSGSTSFAAHLELAGRPVLVVGAGPDALPKITALRAARATVTVFAERALPSIQDMAERGLISWQRRTLDDVGLQDFWLVVAASNDAEIDLRTEQLCTANKVFCLRGSGLVPAVEPQTGTLRKPGGRVILVGGGPGDPALITIAGAAALREADVVITDRLAPLAALEHVLPGTEIIDVSKIPRGLTTPQEEINRLIIVHAHAGKTVVRFKGGDNFVFGRGGEEMIACAAEGIDVVVIPGVTSAIAAPALAGIPVTHRGLNQGFTVITGHVPPGDARSRLDYEALARTGTDLILLMAVANLGTITAELIARGMPADTPAATIADAGLESQRAAHGTVSTIAEVARAAGIVSPAVTVIGAVAGFDPKTSH
ncbi:uroporphyrinogen-III C-methyltransferase [Nakamurella antarctica]|uniref:uroporphyrinogen-III C-methyltransferase n=1 Tax=Nakamurella antarctica TaxID=1902245 RepID=A0A3G8ZMB3_9ACTN|nr:uroporphyrinogen-III C-methyltransferase [Nakamurella antarctica]AZI58492.1 uroporphyrinogen-III C-methyltransferase [Nakamurella antarctica]